MAFQMPEYHQPDFSKEQFIKAPDAKWEIVEIDGVAPEYFHSTSMFPEYFKIQGKWVLDVYKRQKYASSEEPVISRYRKNSTFRAIRSPFT